jgi:hypothetical protein
MNKKTAKKTVRKKTPAAPRKPAIRSMDKWHEFEILESKIGKIGHQFTVQNGDQKDEIRFVDVRGGWSWPTDQNPYYCIIVGQDFFDARMYADKSPSFSVIAEITDKGLDLEKRFNDLADIAELYKCDFYANLGSLHEPEADSWYDYQAHKSLRHGDLAPGPWAENFRLGVELCKTSIRTRKLSISKDTEVFAQLQKITQKDLADKDVKSRYYCIEALRHVMASYKRDPAEMPHIDHSKRFDSGAQGQSWMF